MPARLIDVKPMGPSGDVRLVHSEGRDREWLTLSHCWGKTYTLKTTHATLSSHLQCISWSSLPATFQDAITITRKLDFQYLWIDSLCIIQDELDDWQAHLAKMGQIYKQSALCIVAEMTLNSNAGIFSGPNKVRQQSQIALPWICPSQNMQGELYTRYPMRCDTYEWGGPLSRRAWTLQESTMGSRIVRYGKEQIYLRRPSREFQESNLLPPPAGAFDRDHQKIFKPLSWSENPSAGPAFPQHG
jgi:hypothetical protein